MKRLLGSSSAAIVVVFGLFVLMMGLIQQEAPAVTIDSYDMSNTLIIETPPIVKPRPKIVEPELKEVLKPDKLPEEVLETKAKINVVDNFMPTLTKLKLGGIDNKLIRVGNSDNFHNGNNEANPKVMIQPPYPPNAIRKNLEGWVKLRFDITRTGSVDNVRVIESKPRGVFDHTARKALYKWKYDPSRVDGETVASNGHEVMLEFNLEKD